jgi:hypothetical protein
MFIKKLGKDTTTRKIVNISPLRKYLQRGRSKKLHELDK